MLLDRTLDAVEAEGADSAAATMTSDEVAAAAVFHVAGLLDRVPTSVEGARVTLGNLAVTILPDPHGEIQYSDIDRSFAIAGADVVDNDGPDTMSGLLTVAQFARDRTDALLYLPGPMRQERINDLAHAAGAGDRFVRSLLVNYKRIVDGIGS